MLVLSRLERDNPSPWIWNVLARGELVDPDELLQIDLDSEVQAASVDRAMLRSSGRVAEHLAHVGRREFHAVVLKADRRPSVFSSIVHSPLSGSAGLGMEIA
jgi:hypothetical protein